MGLSNEQMEKIAVFTGLFLIVLLLIYQVLIFFGLVPGIPFCGGIPCITVFMGIGLVLSTYAVYRYGGKRDKKTDEQLRESYKQSTGLLKVTIILSMISILIVILVIGCLASIYFYIQYQDSLKDSQDAARAAFPFYSSNANSPQLYNGPIILDQKKLVQTDPIVAIWQSTDGSLQNADGSYIPVPQNFNNYILVIYNDQTYLLFDRQNNTYLIGTWEKTVDNPYYNEYTVREGDSTLPATKITYSHYSIQYTYTYKDDPPHSILSYINYRLLDHYPLKSDTQNYVNSRD